MSTIRISDYLTEEKNATPAIVAALKDLHDGDTLTLEGKSLELYALGAPIKYYDISNNDCGNKPIVFLLSQRENITIDGEGAALMFHGRVLPFTVDNSKKITIKNLSIDYASPFYAQAEIVEADSEHTVLQFDQKEFCARVQNGNFCFYSKIDGWENEVTNCLVTEFEKDTGAPSATLPAYFPYSAKEESDSFLRGMFRDVDLKELAPGKIEMRGNLGFTHTVGNIWLCTHSTREFPGIFITDSKDVTVSCVDLFYTASMGVIAQMSENLTLEKVKATPKPGSGRYLSVNADATHFVNCRGYLRVRDCLYERMMDDAMNVHGIYGKVLSTLGNTIKVGYGHGQQEGVLFCKQGDKIALIDKWTMENIYEATVLAVTDISHKEFTLVTSKPVSAKVQNLEHEMLLENLSTAVDVTATGNVTGYNRPRGFLLSTAGKVLIENNCFHNMYSGIQVGGEANGWYESGVVKDITIRNNDFTGCAYAGGCAIDINMQVQDSNFKRPLHEKISITNNKFVQQAPRMLHAHLVKNLIWKDNTFEQSDAYAALGDAGPDGRIIYDCENVDLGE